MAKNYFWLVAALALACFAPGVVAQVSSGTAFAVAPGLLITNQHVVAGCSSIEIIAADGRRTGSVVDADAQIDLALLRVSGLKGATARLRNPRNVRLGESVMVFGFPLAGSLTSGGNFTSGLVSGLRGLRDAAGELQITAPVQRGNSGGPLLDASGLVIGVVQAKLDALRSAIATGDIPQNVNFAISLEVLADFLGKNKVPFRDGAPTSSLNTARVADLAQSFTYRVECRGRSRQAEAFPSMKAKPPMAGPQAPPPAAIAPQPPPPPPRHPFVTEPRLVSTETISVVNEQSSVNESIADHSLVLHVAVLSGSGWKPDDAKTMIATVSKILTQCRIDLKTALIYEIEVPIEMLYLKVDVSRELARALNLPTPTVYLIQDTLQKPAYSGEAFGRGNTRTRMELLHSVWIAHGSSDSGILLTRLLAYVLADKRVTSTSPDNLFYGDHTASNRTSLDPSQCAELNRMGAEQGLLTARP